MTCEARFVTVPAALAWLAFLALLATACTAVPPPRESAPDGTAPSIKTGGVLRTYFESDPNDWDLRTQGKTTVNVAVHGLVYNSLLMFKKGPDVKPTEFILQPGLAERWDVARDAKSFTFSLRPGVRFADVPPVNGRALTSADVKWNLEYLSSTGESSKLPASAMAFMYVGLDRIDTPDPRTVVVHFKEPFAPFMNYSASQWMPMAAREVQQQEGDLKTLLIGTGPFQFDASTSQKGTVWAVKRNPNYWDSGRPYLDGIRRLVLPEIATAQAAFQTKQLDVMTVTAFPVSQDVRKANQEAQVQEFVKGGQPYQLNISQRRGGPLSDVRVRRAISLAIDRDEFNRVISGGRGVPSPPAATLGLFSDTEVKEMLPHDPEAAKRLLAEARYPGNLRLESIVTPGDNTDTLLLQSQLRKVGVSYELTTLPREDHRARLYVGDYDFYTSRAGGLFEADIDSTLFAFYSGSSLNYAQIKDPELDKMLIAQRQEGDPTKRRDLQRAAIRRIVDQAWNPGVIFIAAWDFSQPYVKNFHSHIASGQYDSMAWLDK